MGLKHFALGLLLGFCLMGCAGFSYRYYTLSIPDYEGTLLGPDENGKDDKPFAICQPGIGATAPCVVLQTQEFLKLRQDLLETKQRLKDCEAQ